MKRIAVYCGSSKGARPEYAAAAQALGGQLARERIELVYGGGKVGLMGILADAVLAHGGHVIGVIPEQLVSREVVHEKLPDLRVVKTMHERKALMAELADDGERIDFYCWDLYARVSSWYSAAPEEAAVRKKLRLDTLHALEAGNNETAKIAELVSTAILRRHLETMLRLGIEYDLLPRESEILRLHFWYLAFEQLMAKGVLYFDTEG